MDTTLVTVTVLSMGMAATLSVIVWRMVRLERLRSDARVAALADLAATPASPVQHPAHADLVLNAPAPASSAQTAAIQPLFVERERSSPWGRRVAVMGGLALVVGAIVFVALTAAARNAAEHHARTTTAAAQTAAPDAASLELVSLRDTREAGDSAQGKAGTLTITGLVQNPRSGATLSHVTVTAFTFDDKGTFLASGRTELDVGSLAPGDESPFVINVPVTDAVARYRIGFRGEDGRVIAHIDRRQL
jgi:hypothetical protein